MAKRLIQRANRSGSPILSLDTPSGVDTSTGQAYQPHIRAEATLTLALPKIGLLKENAADAVGKLFLADISVPPELYQELGIEVGPIFAESEIIKIE